MGNDISPPETKNVAVASMPLRIIKRLALVILGPFYFLFIAFVPLLCASKPGFRGWYWRTVKRACTRLLWLLDVRAQMSDANKAALANDNNSIIVINHRSHLDGFALMDVVPDEKWFTFAAKKELCDATLLRTGFTGAGLVPVDRTSGSVAMETLSRAVRDMPPRRSIVLFPEGTRTKTESLGEFKAGAVIVARETGRKILPIVIHDSDKLLGRGKTIPKSGTIRIEALPAFSCDLDASVDADVARLRTEMVAVFDKN